MGLRFARKRSNPMVSIGPSSGAVRVYLIGEYWSHAGIYLDEWCEVSMGVDRLGEEGPWNFPFVKVYKRGGDKLGGEQINLNIRPPTHAGDKLVPDQVRRVVLAVFQELKRAVFCRCWRSSRRS